MTKIGVNVQSLHEKMKWTRVAPTCGCVLLLGALLNFETCNPKPAGQPGGHPHPLIETGSVWITSCTLVQGQQPITVPITVYAGDSQTWNSSDVAYTITFDPKLDKHPGLNTPPTDLTPFPPSYSLSVPAKGSATWNTTTAPAVPIPPDCGDGSPGTSDCYFKYNLYQGGPPAQGGTLCADPGVHVTQNPALENKAQAH